MVCESRIKSLALTTSRILKGVLKELRTQLLSPLPGLVQLLHRSQLVWDEVLIINVQTITIVELNEHFEVNEHCNGA